MCGPRTYPCVREEEMLKGWCNLLLMTSSPLDRLPPTSHTCVGHTTDCCGTQRCEYTGKGINLQQRNLAGSACQGMEVNVVLTQASAPGAPLTSQEMGPVATMASEEKELTLTTA